MRVVRRRQLGWRAELGSAAGRVVKVTEGGDDADDLAPVLVERRLAGRGAPAAADHLGPDLGGAHRARAEEVGGDDERVG